MSLTFQLKSTLEQESVPVDIYYSRGYFSQQKQYTMHSILVDKNIPSKKVYLPITGKVHLQQFENFKIKFPRQFSCTKQQISFQKDMDLAQQKDAVRCNYLKRGKKLVVILPDFYHFDGGYIKHLQNHLPSFIDDNSVLIINYLDSLLNADEYIDEFFTVLTDQIQQLIDKFQRPVFIICQGYSSCLARNLADIFGVPYLQINPYGYFNTLEQKQTNNIEQSLDDSFDYVDDSNLSKIAQMANFHLSQNWKCYKQTNPSHITYDIDISSMLVLQQEQYIDIIQDYTIFSNPKLIIPPSDKRTFRSIDIALTRLIENRCNNSNVLFSAQIILNAIKIASISALQDMMYQLIVSRHCPISCRFNKIPSQIQIFKMKYEDRLQKMAQILSEIFSYSTQQFINNPIIVREIILKSQQTRDQIINSLHISEGSLKTFINNQMVKNTFKLTEKAYIELKLQFLEKQSPCLQKKILSAQLSELQYKGFSYPPSFVNILVQSFNSNDKLYDIIVGKSSKENSDSKNGDFTEQSNYQILVLSEID